MPVLVCNSLQRLRLQLPFFLTLSHEILPTLKPSGPENLVKERIGTNTKVIAGLQIALLEPITIILLPQ